MAQNKLLKAARKAAAVGAPAGAAVLLANAVKKKGVCPFCEIKRLLGKVQLHQTAAPDCGNGAAQTPPMGWSSWNLFATHINENLIEEIADAMEKSGLAAAGYRYVNIDDCWQSSERDEDGRLQADKATFPGGIRALADKVNAKGLKLGIYSSNGLRTCEDYPASLRHEAIDADTFAAWGVEYFKYDFCHNRAISEKAPLVSAIELSRPGEGPYQTFAPSDAVCKGRARVWHDEARKRAYLTGIDARAGSFSVNAEALQDGETVVTLTVRKETDAERFVRLIVGGKDEYHLYAPKMRAPMPAPEDRRVQTTIWLKQGENTLTFDNPVGSRFDSAALQYTLMGRELRRAAKEYAEKNGTPEKPIVYSICEWGFNRPWKWGRQAGNLWRTTGDIKPFWASVMTIYERNVRLWKYAAPGGWNDPDMLEVGVGKLTQEENRAHFSLWCMMAAPLILGNDIRTFVKADGTADETNKTLRLLTNKDMIAIDQDALGQQCRRIKAGLQDVLVKPLTDARVAVCVFNKTNRAAQTALDFKAIANEGFVQLPEKDSYEIYDVWDGVTCMPAASVVAETAPHGVKVYIVK